MLFKHVNKIIAIKFHTNVTIHINMLTVTEKEIQQGILQNEDASKSLTYIRHIDNINTTSLRDAGNFIDIKGQHIDDEATQQLERLRDTINREVEEDNITTYNVEWLGKAGISQETHQEYLQNFCVDFEMYVA